MGKDIAKPLVIFESQRRSPQTQIRARKPAEVFPAVPDRNVINQGTIDLVDNPGFISQPSFFDNPSIGGEDQSVVRPKPSVFDDQSFDLGKGFNSFQEEVVKPEFKSRNLPSNSVFPTQILQATPTTSRPIQQTSTGPPKQGTIIFGIISYIYIPIFLIHRS